MYTCPESLFLEVSFFLQIQRPVHFLFLSIIAA